MACQGYQSFMHFWPGNTTSSFFYSMIWRGWFSHTFTPWPGEAGSLLHLLYDLARLSLSYMYSTPWPGAALSLVHVLHDLAGWLSHTFTQWPGKAGSLIHLLHDLARLALSYIYSMTWRGCLSQTCTEWPGEAVSLIHVLNDLARLSFSYMYSMTWRGWPAGWLWAPWALSPGPAASVQECKLALQTWDVTVLHSIFGFLLFIWNFEFIHIWLMYDTIVLRLHYELNMLVCRQGGPRPHLTKGCFCCTYITEYKYRQYYTRENKAIMTYFTTRLISLEKTLRSLISWYSSLFCLKARY